MSKCHSILATVRPASRLSEVVLNRRFGRLRVCGRPLRIRLSSGVVSHVVCECDCGAAVVVACRNLWAGRTTSCGCLTIERGRAARRRHGYASRHNRHPLYSLIGSMIGRCHNPHSANYRWYGARGITVCREWRDDRAQFVEWGLEHGWAVGLQIDRIDNNGPYAPDNCRFVDATTNARNSRSVTQIMAFGESKSVAEWAEDPRCSVPYFTLCSRLAQQGRDPEEAISAPRRKVLF